VRLATVTDVVFELAEALETPVLVLTALALAAVLIELGAFAVELVRRRRRDFLRLRTVTEEARRLLLAHDFVRARDTLYQVAWSGPMARTLAFFVSEWGRPESETLIAKALADHDFRAMRRLERTRLLVRAGPALGLMGTLIPLSPALAGLAEGDVATLSENLRVAFSVTVLGLLIGAVAFGLSLVRDRLYGQDLSDLEFVASRLTAPAAPAVVAPVRAVEAPAS
jgi:biopolymer transport protein ExbB/TolQ